ncbi:hypothetical protein GGI21_006533, partial [Coemansia aciculifera]
MVSASWVYFAVLADGRVCVAKDDRPVVFDVGDMDEEDGDRFESHVWLPVVSPAVTSSHTSVDSSPQKAGKYGEFIDLEQLERDGIRRQLVKELDLERDGRVSKVEFLALM